MKATPIHQIKEPYEGWCDVSPATFKKHNGFSSSSKRVVFSANDVGALQKEIQTLEKHLHLLAGVLESIGFNGETQEFKAAMQRSRK